MKTTLPKLQHDSRSVTSRSTGLLATPFVQSPVTWMSLATLAYLAIAWILFKPEAVWSPDEGAKLLQLKSLRVEYGSPAYDILYPGRSLDPELHFALSSDRNELLQIKENKLFFQRLPLFPLVSKPFYQWFHNHGMYLLPAIAGALTATLAILLLDRQDRRFRTWLLITFGSPILIYSVTFWEHTLATSLGLAGMWLALKLRPMGIPVNRSAALGWSGVGLLLGASTYLRMELIIFGAALLLSYGLIEKTGRLGTAWAGGILCGLFLLQGPLHGALFGGQPVPDNAAYLMRPAAYLQQARWNAIPDLLIGPSAEEAIAPGWPGWVWSLAAILAVGCSYIAAGRPTVRVLRTAGLGITVIAAGAFLAAPVSYRSAHGLLLSTPWVLLGFTQAGAAWWHSDRKIRVLILTTLIGIALYMLAILGFRGSSPQGGLEWGARFALIFFPLIAIILQRGTRTGQHTVEAALLGALVLLGFGFQARGVWTIMRDKQTNAAINQSIADQSVQPVISDLWWLPYNAAPLHPDQGIFIVDSPGKLLDWITNAKAHQVQRYALVTLNYPLPRVTKEIFNSQGVTIVGNRQTGNLFTLSLAADP